jgi:hypothetical protein
MASKTALQSPCMPVAIAIGQVGQTIFTTEQMMPPGPAKTKILAGLRQQLDVLEHEYRNCVSLHHQIPVQRES